MPYLTACASLDSGDTYTLHVMIAPSWRDPQAGPPAWSWRRPGEPYSINLDGYPTGVRHAGTNEEISAALTAAAEGHGFRIKRGWVFTQFGIQAHVEPIRRD